MSVPNDRALPAGKTCSDCLHFLRCRLLFSAKPLWSSCDFWPSRFQGRPEQLLNIRETPTSQSSEETDAT